jgi:hypothetical protein
MRSSFLLLGLAATLSFASLDAVAATPPPLTIGEVTSEVVRQDVDLGAVLRTMLEQELPGVDIGKPRPKPTVLSVSLVQMERTAPAGSKAQVSVIVNATLRDRRKGAVVAIVEGRARAENEERLVDLLEHAALKSAVRGALSRLPQALDAQR